MNPGGLFGRLAKVVSDPAAQALGEKAVEAGLLSVDDLRACRERAASRPGVPFRAILEEQGVGAQALDVLERLVLEGPSRPPLADRYEIRAEIGEGAMGVVYRAWDRQLKREVAIKFLRADLRGRPEGLRRMRHEALAAARLNHPNLPVLHDVGEEGGLPFLVMELVEGPSLAEEISARRLGPRRAAEALEKAARAVHHVHAQGIIHRDLKPSNLRFDARGEIRVLDFGLVRLVESEGDPTRTGAAVGTPSYMAPEQVRDAKSVDARTDIYGLGSTLYEALSGRPPHLGKTPAEVYWRVLNEDPVPLRKLDPRIDPALDRIAAHALEKDPARRYPTAEAMADDLRRHLSGQGILAPAPSTFRRVARRARAHPAVATLAGVLAGVVVIGLSAWGWSSWQRHRSAADGRAQLEAGNWAAAALAFESAGDRPGKRVADAMLAADRLATRRAELRPATPESAPPLAPHEPASTREARWAAEDLEAKRRRESESLEDEQERLLHSVAPELREARVRLARIYLDRRRVALEARDRASAEAWAAKAREADAATAAPVLDARTRVSIRGEGHLFRYEERKRRLVPCPCAPDGRIREPELRSVDPVSWTASEDEKRAVREGTAYPLAADSFNSVRGELALPEGSYLLLSGGARFPFVVSGVPVSIEASSPRGPEGYAYVAPGPFTAGGDPAALDFSAALRRSEEKILPGYWIQRYSVTFGEYRDFEPAAPEPAPDGPVLGIAPAAARRYAEWKSARDPAWSYRLPTEDEWEKAARGADGRYFPWGDRFEPSFSAWMDSRPVRAQARHAGLERVGLFPADESPYGVRDLAGVARSITSTPSGDAGWWVTKGGGWNFPSLWSRAAHRSAVPDDKGALGVGFRLVAVPK